MKIQFLVLIFSVYLVLSTEACNTARDRQICANLNQRCRATNRPPVGPTDTLTVFNSRCRAQIGATWRNLGICDLLRASCEVTIIRCQNINCRNVRAVV